MDVGDRDRQPADGDATPPPQLRDDPFENLLETWRDYPESVSRGAPRAPSEGEPWTTIALRRYSWIPQALTVGISAVIVLLLALYLPNTFFFDIPGDGGQQGFDLVEGRVEQVLSSEVIEPPEDVGIPLLSYRTCACA
ncbi:MAG: hypothetical protein WEB00_01355 [Dehalococcoidia bacterium]